MTGDDAKASFVTMSMQRLERRLEALSRPELEAMAERGTPRGNPVLPYVLMATPVLAVAGIVVWVERGQNTFSTLAVSLTAAGFLWLARAFRRLTREEAETRAAREELARRKGRLTLEGTHPAARGIAALSTPRIREELSGLEHAQRIRLGRNVLSARDSETIMATGVAALLAVPAAMILATPFGLMATLLAVAASLCLARVAAVLWTQRFGEDRAARQARARLLRRELARRSARALQGSDAEG